MEKTPIDASVEAPIKLNQDAFSKSSGDANADDTKADYSSKAANKVSFKDYRVCGAVTLRCLC